MTEPTLSERLMRVALLGVVPVDDPHVIADAQQEIDYLKIGDNHHQEERAKLEAEIERLQAQRNEKAQEIVGWKRTALAMRDLAIYWDRDDKSRYEEIELLYFNAAMFGKFAPGNAFAHEQSKDPAS